MHDFSGSKVHSLDQEVRCHWADVHGEDGMTNTKTICIGGYTMSELEEDLASIRVGGGGGEAHTVYEI